MDGAFQLFRLASSFRLFLRMSHNKSPVSHIHSFHSFSRSLFRFIDSIFGAFVHTRNLAFKLFFLYSFSFPWFDFFMKMKKIPTNRATENKMHFQHDDKNTHFVIASTIAPADQPFIFPGGMQRTNPQSQSFPDLSRKIDLRSMKGVGGGGGDVRPMYKSSRLPVASRYVNKRNLSSRLNRKKCVASSWPIAFSCVFLAFQVSIDGIEYRSAQHRQHQIRI